MKTLVGLLLMVLSLSACENLPELLETGAQISSAVGYDKQSSLVGGIKEALELSSTRASQALTKTGAYAENPLYRIALPDSVQPVTKRMRQFGLGAPVDKIEQLMNRGAEQAAAEAKDVFIRAVREMSVNDALSIVQGGDNAATHYFRAQTESSLRAKYLPIVQQNLSQVGFYNQYKQFLTTYKQLPISNKPDLDLEQHVLNQSLNALFSRVGDEEKLIRQDPVGRGSSIIGAVFGGGN